MSVNVNLAQLSNLNSTSILSQSNANFAAIQTALTDAVSRSGGSPNNMNSALDMNNQQIINLPAPSTINSPARLLDVVSNPSLTIPGTGTSGHVVPFLDGNNTWSGINTYSGGGGIAFTQAGTGAVSNTVDAKIKQYWVTPEDFGAKHDGLTDDTAAIQAALNAILANGGGTLYLPPSLNPYRTVAQLTYNVTAVSGRFKNALTIQGSTPQGSAFVNTTIATPLFQYTGSVGQDESYLWINRVRFSGNNSFVAGSQGINIIAGAWITLDHVLIELFDIGLQTTDVDQFAIYNSNIRFNNKGVLINSGSFTSANTWTFVNTLLAGNTTYGLDGTNCNGFSYFGGSVQGNGSIGGPSSQYGIALHEAGTGYGTVLFSGMQFEGNGGIADFVSTQSAQVAVVNLHSVSFFRTSVGFGTNCILASGTTASVYKLSGCTFVGSVALSGYTPSAGRPVINITNISALIHDDGTNEFANAVEAPATIYPIKQIIGFPRAGPAWQSFTPVISSGTGTFTTTSATGRWMNYGKTVWFEMVITTTTIGTAATSMIATLPFTANATSAIAGFNTSTGLATTGTVTSGTSNVTMFKYDGTFPAANGNVFTISGTCEMQ